MIFIVMDNGNEDLALVKIENPGQELEYLSCMHALYSHLGTIHSVQMCTLWHNL